jgi:DNA-binding transcriptional ArsR family regulator
MSLEALSAVWNLDLDKNQQDVLEVLAWHANADMVCWPSKARIMYKTGLSDSTVKRALGALKKSGLITVEAHAEGGRGRAPLYKLHPDKGVSKPPFEEWRKGFTGDDKGGQGEQEKGGRAVTPEPRTENQEQEPSYPPKPPQGGVRVGKTIKAPSSAEYVVMFEEFVATDALGEPLRELVTLAAAENTTGRKRYSAAYTGFVEPLRKMRTDGLTDAAIKAGLDAAINASAPNMNYVKKVAKKYEPETDDLFQGHMSRTEREKRRKEGRAERKPDLPEDFDAEAVKREWEAKKAKGAIGLGAA